MICASCVVDIVFIFIVLCMLRANLGAAISITFTVTNVTFERGYATSVRAADVALLEAACHCARWEDALFIKSRNHNIIMNIISVGTYVS